MMPLIPRIKGTHFVNESPLESHITFMPEPKDEALPPIVADEEFRAKVEAYNDGLDLSGSDLEAPTPMDIWIKDMANKLNGRTPPDVDETK